MPVNIRSQVDPSFPVNGQTVRERSHAEVDLTFDSEHVLPFGTRAFLVLSSDWTGE